VSNAPSRTVVAALIAFLVMALSLFGALEAFPQWVRGTAQAIGTLAGIYLGAHFQAHDNRKAAEGAAKSSVVNLVALAKGIGALIQSIADTRERLQSEPPRSLDAYQNAFNGMLTGVDAQGRAILAQAEAATAAWLPFVRDDDPFMKQFGGSSTPSSAETDEG